MTNTDSDNSREWAAQAYALLKKRQEEQKQELEKQEEQKKEFSLQPDGSVITDGNSKIRDLNGFMNWSINDENAKTVNGLILKTIDEIPIANLCFTNESYRFEILKIKNNSISSVKIQRI